MRQKNNRKSFKRLYQVFLTLKTEEEVARFLDDLLTIREIKKIANRLKITELLYRKKGSYQEIAQKVKTSTTTVTRSARILNYGKGSFKKIFKRILEKKSQNN